MDRKNLPVIVCDIDNTVSKQLERLKRFYDEKKGEVSDEANFPETIINDEVIPGAVEALNNLAQKYKIVWLTSRNADLEEVTYAWLKKNNFPIDELILVDLIEKKLPILLKIKPFLFIDDLQYDLFSLKPKPASLFKKNLDKHKINYYIFSGSWKKVINYIRSTEKLFS